MLFWCWFDWESSLILSQGGNVVWFGFQNVLFGLVQKFGMTRERVNNNICNPFKLIQCWARSFIYSIIFLAVHFAVGQTRNLIANLLSASSHALLPRSDNKYCSTVHVAEKYQHIWTPCSYLGLRRTNLCTGQSLKMKDEFCFQLGFGLWSRTWIKHYKWFLWGVWLSV